MTPARLNRGTLPGPSMLLLCAAILSLLSTMSWLSLPVSLSWHRSLELKAATAMRMNATTLIVVMAHASRSTAIEWIQDDNY